MSEIRFGTDGWRGVIAEEFTFANVRRVARAIGRRLRAEAGEGAAVLVGYDTRFLSREFAQAAAESLAAEGAAVALAGRFAPTPALSYAVVARRARCGVVITASHNPARYNGLKIKAAFGGSAPLAFTRAVEEELGRVGAERGDPHAAMPTPPCAIVAFDPVEPWLDRLEQLVDLDRIGRSGIRVALDAMYGAGQGLLAGRLRRAGCRVDELHAEVNPGFGGLHPEPIPAQLGALVEHVRSRSGAGRRVGFAFDGDSDRIAPVDETGGVVTPHQVLALLVRHLVRHRNARGPIVKSVNIGRMVDLEAAALALPVVVTPIGFKFIAEAMRERDALVGGEESGGFAVRGHTPERDPGLVCLLLLELMATTGRSLGALVRQMEAEYGPHRYGRVDLRLETLAARDRVVQGVTAAPPDRLLERPVREVDARDGVKLIRDDGSWVMLRASGTEPLLRIYAEAATEEEVGRLLAWGEGLAHAG